MRIVTEYDNGSTVQLINRENLQVRLKVPAGVDYAWVVFNLDNQRWILERTYFERNYPGAECDYQSFQFRPLRSGQSVIELRYTRPFERGYKPPFNIFRVQVSV